jgi:acyl carrier protein
MPLIHMVVPEDEEKWPVQAADDEVVVSQREVTGAQHKVHLAVPFFQTCAVDQGIHVIGDAEQSHSVFLNIVNRFPACNGRPYRRRTAAPALTIPVFSGIYSVIHDPRRDIMDKMEIQEKIVSILARHTSVDRSALTPKKDLKLDLGLDSLDVAEIVYEMEETFGIHISDESAERIQKISDTVDFVHEKIAESEQGGLSAQER